MGRFRLGRWVISANFQSESFRSGCFGQSLKVIMYALLYVYEWTDVQVLSFVKKSGLNIKKGPLSQLRLKQAFLKCPRRGQNDLLTLHCDSG